jgi:hypothetical protein
MNKFVEEPAEPIERSEIEEEKWLTPLRVRVRIEKLSGGGAKLPPNKWSEIRMNVDLWHK